ncbi:histidine kinase [Saprospiraceae bacterium]|nr:histidine kinase [Saprospiraceae bacterium]
MIFYAIVVYFNLLFLIPQYFKEGKLLSYAVFLFFSVLLISPIKTLCLYSMFYNFPFIQQGFVDNQAFIFLSSLFVGASSTIFQILSDWQKSDIDRKELEYKTTQTELNFLRSQINPHFLFNTLNNLYALTLKKSNAAPETVLKLSEIMRYMLYECNERQVLLSKEINYLKNYIELEKLRLNDSFEIILKVEGDVGTHKIAPLILTPFIENAFKHGINQQLDKGFIHISLKVIENHLNLAISNSKGSTGPKESPIKKSGGIGLQNVKRRMEILYPSTHELVISDDIEHYNIELKIKLDE